METPFEVTGEHLAKLFRRRDLKGRINAFRTKHVEHACYGAQSFFDSGFYLGTSVVGDEWKVGHDDLWEKIQ